jgi:hypothetical protein
MVIPSILAESISYLNNLLFLPSVVSLVAPNHRVGVDDDVTVDVVAEVVVVVEVYLI